MNRRELERTLQEVEGFSRPIVELEQYPTDPVIAAHLLHRADLWGDIDGQTVVDLGAGTGMLTIGAALLGAERVVALERDRAAITVGRRNVDRLGGGTRIEWLQADVDPVPVCLAGCTVVANPPFGAQDGKAGADRPFLAAAAEVSSVSYSIHNAGSTDFVREYAHDHGGEILAAFSVEMDIDHAFEFHEDDRRTLTAEAYRIQW